MILAALALIASACSGGDALLIDDVTPPAAVDASSGVADPPEDTKPPRTEAPPKPVRETVSTTTAPRTRPIANEVVANAADAVEDPFQLSIDDVVLTEESFDDPWRFQGRTLVQFTYDSGPQQSDCADYWFAEKVTSQASASASWWRDGANLVQSVATYDKESQAEKLMAAAGRVAAKCPVISRGEGDHYFAESPQLDIAPVDGVETVVYLVDAGSSVTWRVFSRRANVVSSLSIPTWDPFDGVAVTEDDVVFAANTAAQHLANADWESVSSPSEPPNDSQTLAEPDVVIDPVETKPNYDDIDGIGTEFAPIDEFDNFVDDLPSYADDLPTDLVALLLTGDEVGDGWPVSAHPQQYWSSPPTDEDIAECPGWLGFVALDQILAVEVNIHGNDGGDVSQIVGRAPTAEAAVNAVNDFVDVEPCLQDLAVGPDGVVDESSPDAAVTVELLELEGAQAAAIMTVSGEWPGSAVVFAVDDIVFVLSDNGLPLLPDAERDQWVALMIGKVSDNS